MSRRVPIDDAQPSVGAHRPETVAGRLAAELITELAETTTHLHDLGGRMASLDDTLARLDAVVAAAADVQTTVRASVEAEVAEQVDQRVAALEAALGMTPPADPTPDPPGRSA